MDSAGLPAYGESMPPPPIRRSVADTKMLIMGNLNVLRCGKQLDDVDILTMPLPRAAHPVLTSASRHLLFPRLRSRDPHEAVLWYALIASRRSPTAPVSIFLKSEPSACLEDALESLLHATQDLVQTMVLRHGAWEGFQPCCVPCNQMLMATRNLTTLGTPLSSSSSGPLQR